MLEEFHSKGLLFVWEENGKRYGHWTGSDVPGRLPAPSWRARLERVAPPVPQEALAKYLSSFSSSRLKQPSGGAQAQGLGSGLDLDSDGEVNAAAVSPSQGNEVQSQSPEALVRSPSGTPQCTGAQTEPSAVAFEHSRIRVSLQLDSKLAQEFPALPEPARRAEYERMAAKLEEAGESARHPGNYARAWLRGLSGGTSASSVSSRTQRVQGELRIGWSPRAADVGVFVKPAVLERIRAREAVANATKSPQETAELKSKGVASGMFFTEEKEKAS